MAEFSAKKYYRDMERLFKGGPLVRHRIANKVAGPGQTGVPVGTARAFLKHINNSYSSAIASYGQYSRLARYSDYNEMESMAEVGSALDIYAEECCVENEAGEILKIDSPNSEIRKSLNTLFYDVLNIPFNASIWLRNLCKYGDQFLLVDHHPDYGVLNVLPMPVNEVEREEGYDPDNPLAYRYRWITQGNRVLENWQVIHFRLMANDNFLPYGSAILEPARRVWRQLILMEDAVMVYRIVRSPERRVFYIDVGNVAPQDIPEYVEKAQTQLKRNQVVDASTGRVDLRYNPMSTDEDYMIPIRGEHSSRIETLPGGQFTGDIDDLVYIQNKLFAALKIPKSYLGYEQDISAKATLSQEDVRFAKTIQKIQKVFVAELNKIAVIHLYSMGFKKEELINFELSMANPSSIAELQRLELWRSKFEVASLAQEGVLDRNTVYTKLFNMSEADIAEIEEGKRKDRLFDLELEGMQLPASAAGIPATGGEEMLPPEEEVPPTAPAEAPPPGDAGLPPPPGEAGPITAGRDPNLQQAMPNDMTGRGRKKKKHLNIPDLAKISGDVKGTGMDPKRNYRELNRLIKAPFGESEDIEELDLSEATEEKIFQIRAAQLRRIVKNLESVEKLNPIDKKKVISE